MVTKISNGTEKHAVQRTFWTKLAVDVHLSGHCCYSFHSNTHPAKSFYFAYLEGPKPQKNKNK